jgi:hypothetical protein
MTEDTTPRNILVDIDAPVAAGANNNPPAILQAHRAYEADQLGYEILRLMTANADDDNNNTIIVALQNCNSLRTLRKRRDLITRMKG